MSIGTTRAIIHLYNRAGPMHIARDGLTDQVHDILKHIHILLTAKGIGYLSNSPIGHSICAIWGVTRT